MFYLSLSFLSITVHVHMLLSHSLAAHMKVLQESAYSLDEGDADDVNQTEYKMN